MLDLLTGKLSNDKSAAVLLVSNEAFLLSSLPFSPHL